MQAVQTVQGVLRKTGNAFLLWGGEGRQGDVMAAGRRADGSSKEGAKGGRTEGWGFLVLRKKEGRGFVRGGVCKIVLFCW